MHELRLSFGEPQLFNLEALPFIYDQYVVIELADELYNSVPVCLFLCFVKDFHIGRKLENLWTRRTGALNVV